MMDALETSIYHCISTEFVTEYGMYVYFLLIIATKVVTPYGVKYSTGVSPAEPNSGPAAEEEVQRQTPSSQQLLPLFKCFHYV